MEKEGFIYIWYDRKRKMYYLGCHWGTIDDGYICSSVRMRNAYAYRKQDFKRRVIQRNIPRENLLEEEFKWLSLIDDTELKTKYYNISKRHFGHWAHVPESEKSLEIRDKLSRNATERMSNYKIRQKISNTLRGKKLTESHKRNISLGTMGRKVSDVTRRKLSLKNTGYKHTDEARQKMKMAKLGKKRQPHTSETKEKMRLAAIRREEIRRNERNRDSN